MQDLLKYFGVFAIAGLAAALVVFALLTLGLVMHEYVVYPLALAAGGICATLAAGFAADLLFADGKRSRLLPAVLVVELVVALIAGVSLGMHSLRLGLTTRIFDDFLTNVALLTIVAVGAVLYFRADEARVTTRKRDVVILIAVVLVGVPVTIWLASLAGLTGA